MSEPSTIHRLEGAVRHYQWGGSQYIANLLGRACDGQPIAEYWLGAHPSDPARIRLDGKWQDLDAAIAAQPRQFLGSLGEWPYLLKVLDVAKPLSLQVHPDESQARLGFAAENSAGIAFDSPRRNFKDPCAKPELVVALSDFWLMYGFRETASALAQLDVYPSCMTIAATLRSRGMRAAFEQVMTATDRQLETWLRPVLLSARATGKSDKSTPAYWLRKWQEDSETPSADRGLFGFLLMNIARLSPGDGLFQAAGIPHAYLGGQCVEAMANSDNVLRCGLTPKHIDVDALLKHVIVDQKTAAIIRAQTGHAQRYRVETPAFKLVRVQGNVEHPHCANGSSILLVISGSCHVDAGAEPMNLDRGQACLVEPRQSISIKSSAGDLDAYLIWSDSS